MFSQLAVVLALSAAALGNVFITSPVAATTFTGGQQATVSWQDDGAAPSLAQFGASKISIYVGNAQQQTSLQLISASTDVSKANTINFVPDATIGPNSNVYFVRFESLALKDATNPQFPALAFSAKFTMAGMTGTFSPAVQAQINGASTNPVTTPAATTAAPATTKAPVVTTTAKPATTTAKPATTTKANSTSDATTAHSSFVFLGAAVLAAGAALY